MKNCTYCGCVADTRDHVTPFSYNDSTGKRKSAFRGQKENIVPACKQCNSIGSNKHFDGVDKKREYIQERLEQKYKRLLKIPDWSEEEIKKMGHKFRKEIRLKMIAKRWVWNRIAYPTVLYPEQPIRQEVKKILEQF